MDHKIERIKLHSPVTWLRLVIIIDLLLSQSTDIKTRTWKKKKINLINTVALNTLIVDQFYKALCFNVIATTLYTTH